LGYGQTTTEKNALFDLFFHLNIIQKYQITDSYPSSPKDDGHSDNRLEIYLLLTTDHYQLH
jgi:hypothetical protein